MQQLDPTLRNRLLASRGLRRSLSGGNSSSPAHLDFRAFVDTLRENNDLTDITSEVDPKLEVAAAIRLAYEQRTKTPLFHNVKGEKDGLFRILGAPAGFSSDSKYPYRRLAEHLALPKDAGVTDVIDKMLSAKRERPLPPVHVSTGPCKENIIMGGDVDLTKLPAPLLNKADGGNYIQTLGINIIPHPTEPWTNWSIARAMVYDKTRMVGLIMKPQHIARIFEEWKKTGNDVPYAIALGAPPIATMAASMSLPSGVSESEYVGALCGSPLELVKCETNNMYVPATSEIVLEGTISITDTAKEGPFGEMHGYSFLDENSQQPLYTVKAITYRNNPILPVCVPGRANLGPDETHTMIGTLASAEIRHLLQQHGLPVTQVFALFETQVIWAAVQVDRKKLAEMKTNAKDLCTKIGDLVFHNKCGMQIHRLLVVGEDINPFDMHDVTWAFATRCRPTMDEFHFEDVPAYPLVPYMSHGPGTKLTGGKVVANCLLPEEYEGKQGWVTCDFENGYPEDIKKRVLSRRQDFGI
ncbi:related to 3-polyprenyl-4-hydroxybenzoate decarboxylase and related decarboxylases [Fusarium fujikuroi]|nr:related to 3-polyprenyl-4-hydroxybenzoate decarboxylase and related decarboxylases [Fusarium fujikuroi]